MARLLATSATVAEKNLQRKPAMAGEHSLEFGASLCDPSTGEPFVTTSLDYALTIS